MAVLHPSLSNLPDDLCSADELVFPSYQSHSSRGRIQFVQHSF